MKPSDWLIFQ